MFSIIDIWNRFSDIIYFFQLRAKSLNETNYKSLYLEILNHYPNAKVIVNDFWEIGILLQAFGVHIGKEDFQSLSGSEKNLIRRQANLLKGTSSHSYDDLEQLDTHLWDYTGYGPIFETKTKDTQNPILGVENLKLALLQTKIPLVPIGGINIESFSSVFQVGKVLPASIGMLADEKSVVKIVDFIRNTPQRVRESKSV